ncbi:thioredoxin peroxidase [Ammoniphilus oxalaticus]|uniref:Thioredoxin peroxidase n=2 Tax=Ammoniphilus oxalaticus TaxID=66863 RepID=A0A419SEV6_9BACL|nr:thioredoxin peroxidase [Ammoniphilus oxalaticus]
MSLVGRQAPHFEMETALGNGEDFGQASLSDYKGKYLIFFFYPLDFTFVCPTEIKALSDAVEEFKDLDTEILGVSTDSKFSHRAWIATSEEDKGLGGLNFPLAADYKKEVAEAYGVLNDEGIAQRGLFIIDPEGIIQYQVITPDSVGRSVDETLRVLQAIQAGGLCPANWRPGEEML